MKRLKVGIVGAGMAFERLRYPAYQELNANYEIVAICDADKTKATYWAQKLGLGAQGTYTDFQELVTREDLQVIDIMVSVESSFTVTEAVAKAVSGTPKAIICKKPIASTLAEAKRYAELTHRYKIPMMMIAENYRYNEDPNIIRDLVREGHIGGVDYFVWNRVIGFLEDRTQNTFTAKEWRQHPDFPGGVFYDTIVHDIAVIRHIFGAIDELMAYSLRKDIALDQLAVINVIFRFISGFTGSYSFCAGGKEVQRPLIGLRILGRNGEIYQEERDSGVINIAYNNGSVKQLPYRPQRGYYNQMLNFYNAYLGKEPVAVTPEIEYGDARTIFAILESIEGETPVKVDQEADFFPAYQRNKEEYQEWRM